jgi:hypothetical protein
MNAICQILEISQLLKGSNHIDLIRPFHHLVVGRMMRAGVQQVLPFHFSINPAFQLGRSP